MYDCINLYIIVGKENLLNNYLKFLYAIIIRGISKIVFNDF